MRNVLTEEEKKIDAARARAARKRAQDEAAKEAAGHKKWLEAQATTSEYEKLREKNIAKNTNFLRMLGL